MIAAMFDQLLTYCDPNTMLAILCMLLSVMVSGLYVNQVRIERESKYICRGLRHDIEATYGNIEILNENMNTTDGYHDRIEGLHRISMSHTKLIHDLTPKKRKHK